jgi:hypothetical protein
VDSNTPCRAAPLTGALAPVPPQTALPPPPPRPALAPCPPSRPQPAYTDKGCTDVALEVTASYL